MKTITTEAYHRFPKDWIFNVLTIDIISFYRDGRVGIPTSATSSARRFVRTFVCNYDRRFLDINKIKETWKQRKFFYPFHLLHWYFGTDEWWSLPLNIMKTLFTIPKLRLFSIHCTFKLQLRVWFLGVENLFWRRI